MQPEVLMPSQAAPCWHEMTDVGMQDGKPWIELPTQAAQAGVAMAACMAI